MRVTPFPADKITKIKKSIDRALKDGATPIAAFDADGTLWNMDMGEHFFDYQVRNRLLPGLPDDPWAHYRKLHKEHAPTAFLWLAQINEGQTLKQVQQWSQKAFQEINPVPTFPGVVEILRHLQKSDVAVYVVTASITWSVEPGAEFLGIPRENVIGVQTKVHKGLICGEQDGVVTWREGKVTGLLNVTERRLPFFAAGNTLGDLPLLDSASHIRLANHAAPPGNVNFETESRLVEIAKTRGWFFHAY